MNACAEQPCDLLCEKIGQNRKRKQLVLGCLMWKPNYAQWPTAAASLLHLRRWCLIWPLTLWGRMEITPPK